MKQLGNEAIENKDCQAALDFYDQGIDLTPPDDFDLLSKFISNKGRCYDLLMEDYSEAMKFYSKAIELNPDSKIPRYNRM